MKKYLFPVLASFAVLAMCARADEDDLLPVALGPVVAIKPVLEKAVADGKAITLETIVRGLETALTAELSNNDSPFALIGGNVGANLYKKIIIDQKSPTTSDGEEEVQYGLTVEITSFTDSIIGPVQRSGISVVQRDLTVTASAIMHDVGLMRATVAIPAITATGKRTNSVRSNEEVKGAIAQSDAAIGELQANLARQLAAGLLTAYYKFPAYVIDVNDDEVTIDQGKAWCQVGDILTLYDPPSEVIASTRVRIKQERKITVPGKRIGTITVTDVFGTASRCKLNGLSGQINGIAYKKGDN